MEDGVPADKDADAAVLASIEDGVDETGGSADAMRDTLAAANGLAVKTAAGGTIDRAGNSMPVTLRLIPAGGGLDGGRGCCGSVANMDVPRRKLNAG